MNNSPPAANADGAFARLREGGPAAWADVGASRCVLAAFEEELLPVDAGWKLRARAGGEAPCESVGGMPSAGWWGWFGYESGMGVDAAPEPLPSPDIAGRPFALPRAWLGRYTGVAVLDRRTGAWAFGGRAAAVERLRDAVAGAARLPEPGPPVGRRLHDGDRERYEAGVARILEHLRAGDCYQVNLARRVDFAGVGDPLDVWRRLRATNPARRGMLLATPHGAVVSNTPELLLSVRPAVGGARLRSHPIKGTAPRAGLDDGARRASAEALLRSPKERAELTMIVDLVRADLGHIAVPGSVAVEPRRVGAVGHVWHAIRPVTATLAPGLDAVDALAAVFPAGSITGAPRVRAMEVIRALETAPRGVYCGALGWFGDDGSARWNVAIRTVSVQDDRARLHAGAGIVIGSDPRREYRETVLKADRMAAALEAR